MREQVLEAAKKAIGQADAEGVSRLKAVIQIRLAGPGRRCRRLEAVRRAPWGVLVGDPGTGMYEFYAAEVVRYLEGQG